MKALMYFLLLFLLFPVGLFAQENNAVIPVQAGIPTFNNQDGLLSSPKLGDHDGLGVAIEMTGFFKNSEFFSPLEEGQTLPGIRFAPRLTYQIADKFRMEWGGYAVYYSGNEHRDKAFNQMFVRMQYAVNPDFNLVLGNIYGGLNHRLIEPLYQWERHYTARPESGLQVNFQNKKYFADVWLDWERFIRRGDSKPEKLTFGISSSALLTSSENHFRFSVPFQLLIHHQGGQIDTSDEPKIVIGNAATGFHAEWLTGYHLLQSLALKTYVVGYYDNTENKSVRPFTKGWGVYPVLEARTKLFTLMAGYWHATDFYAFEGESLFGSFNPYNPEQQIRNRDLVTAKLLYQQELGRDLHAGAQVEIYGDCGLKRTDYSFGVSLEFRY
ncbi:MAG: hypothetical protein LBN93_01395 [Candidatus Symbiothrix sp.]|jgi:hypothetical protein|nr:hypothetical protein [Candidatus Symbiothrix sp.]